MFEDDVTILIPIRNGAPYLADLFKYLDANIPKGLPVLIIEDHSTDESFALIEEFSRNLRNVSLLRNQGSGLVDALNYGFSLCKTSWVARMDVDDIYAPNRILRQLPFRHDNVAVIFSDYRIFKSGFRRKILLTNALCNDEIIVSLVKNRRTPHPATMINRKLFLQVGGYRKNSFPAEDLDLWFRLSSVGKLIGVPEELLDYRRHGLSVTATARKKVLEKHSEIIASSEFHDALASSFKSTLKNLEDTLNFYKKFANPDVRIFLLVLDIFYVYLLYPKLRVLKFRYLSFLIQNLIIYRGALRFLAMYLMFRTQFQFTFIRTHSSGKESKING